MNSSTLLGIQSVFFVNQLVRIPSPKPLLDRRSVTSKFNPLFAIKKTPFAERTRRIGLIGKPSAYRRLTSDARESVAASRLTSN